MVRLGADEDEEGMLRSSPGRPAGARPGRGRQVGVGEGIGHSGEILQGAFRLGSGRPRQALVTLPCPLFHSQAVFTAGGRCAVVVEPAHKVKARRAAELALAHHGHPGAGGHLRIESNIPESLGLGSSTSDVVAAIRAVASAFGACSPPEAVARLAVRAETASDSTMFDGRVVLFAQREARILATLGSRLPPLTVLGFDTDPGRPGIDTLSHEVPTRSAGEIHRFDGLLAALGRAVEDGDAQGLGEVATASATINQGHLPKRRFEDVVRLARSVGACGVQVAHSGTAAGLLFAGTGAREDAIAQAAAGLRALGMGRPWRFQAGSGR